LHYWCWRENCRKMFTELWYHAAYNHRRHYGIRNRCSSLFSGCVSKDTQGSFYSCLVTTASIVDSHIIDSIWGLNEPFLQAMTVWPLVLVHSVASTCNDSFFGVLNAIDRMNVKKVIMYRTGGHLVFWNIGNAHHFYNYQINSHRS